MCGIAGFVDDGRFGRQERLMLIDRMCRIISHRGPDDQGVMVESDVAIGMRRLSIIDVQGGRQPLSNEDGSVNVVFNGEIYNYRELQSELESRGHQFQTRSDTEAIVHAYEEFGERCVDRFRGMFAFAIWDSRRKRLFIARDRAGKKPLFYTVTREGSFVFGSELKSLLEHPEVERDVDPQAIDAYLSLGYVPDPLTVFRRVKKLPPGYHLTFSEGHLTTTQYWDFDFVPVHTQSEDDITEQLRELLDEAVRIRLMSEVPLGAFLSGGIDSSTVVALMTRHMGQPVKTFSIGFNEDTHNELKYARIAAKHLQTDHHEFIVTPEICDVVDELVWHFDEPFADMSAIPTYMVSKLAREHVTVALTGDGGDELFSGYTRYVVDRKRSGFARLPRSFRQGVLQPLSQRLPHGAWGRNFINNISLDPLERYLDSVSAFTKLSKASLYAASFRSELNGNRFSGMKLEDYADRVSTGDALDQLLYIDSKTYLPGDILTKVDRMSMAVSLEARAPLLDHRLIDFVTRIPASLKMRGAETKHILKRAVREIVPPEILHRPKMGFGVPIASWINKQLRDRMIDTLTDPRTLQRGYINPAYVQVLLDEHRRGRRDQSRQLWTLLMLELWHREFVDRRVATPSFERQIHVAAN